MSRILAPRFYIPGEKLYVALLIYLLAAIPLDTYSRLTDTLGTTNAGNPLQQMVWTGAYGLAFLPLLGLYRNVSWLWKKNLLLLILVLMACFSAFWSLDPDTTLRRSAACFGTFLLGTYLAVRFSPAEMVRLMAMGLGLAALSSFALAYLSPNDAIMQGTVHEGRWRGVYTHKNELGRYMALGVLVSLLASTVTQGWLRRATFAGAGLCAALLLLSQSATALVVAVLTLVAWAIVSRIRRSAKASRHRGAALAVTLVTSSLLMLAFVCMENELFLQLLGRNSDLTQRLQLWRGVLAGVEAHPWLGFGYEVFWDKSRGVAYSYISGFMNWDAPHAHNGLLQLAINLGLVGVVLFVGHFMQVAVRTVRLLACPGEKPESFMFIILLLTLLVNMMEVTIMRDNNLLWVAYIYVALRSSAALEANRATATAPSTHAAAADASA